jgi:hypothetical protein
MVAQAIVTARAAGATGRILIRGDSAYGSRAVVRACLRGRAEFSLVMTKNRAVARDIASIPDTAWTPVRYPGAVQDPDTPAGHLGGDRPEHLLWRQCVDGVGDAGGEHLAVARGRQLRAEPAQVLRVRLPDPCLPGRVKYKVQCPGMVDQVPDLGKGPMGPMRFDVGARGRLACVAHVIPIVSGPRQVIRASVD